MLLPIDPSIMRLDGNWIFFGLYFQLESISITKAHGREAGGNLSYGQGDYLTQIYISCGHLQAPYLL